VILPAVVLGLASRVGAADEKAPSGSVERKALDEGVYKTLRDIINRGADLYNTGDRAACYRLYEGALLALKPLLDHRPDAQKAIDAGVADADRMPAVADRAFALRSVIDKIRNDIHPRKVDNVAGGTKAPLRARTLCGTGWAVKRTSKKWWKNLSIWRLPIQRSISTATTANISSTRKKWLI
jgi:hypothetical protein